MTAYVCQNTGWTWDEVEDRMTIPRLQALEKVWETSPPIARSLSWLAQSKGFKIKKPRQKTKGAARELADAINGIGG